MRDPALHQSQFHPTCCVTPDTSSPPQRNTYQRRRPVDYDVFEISPTVRACTRHAYADWPPRRGRNPLGRGSPAVACSQHHRQAPLAEGTTGATSDLRARHTAGWRRHSAHPSPYGPNPEMHLVSALVASHQSSVLPPRTVPSAESSLPTRDERILVQLLQ